MLLFNLAERQYYELAVARQRVNSKTTQLCLTLQSEALCKQSVREWISGYCWITQAETIKTGTLLDFRQRSKA